MQQNATISPPITNCTDFDVRLVNMTVNFQGNGQVFSGNVEACVGGSFFSICDTDWDDVEAQLICNTAGSAYPLYRKSYTLQL